MRSQRGGSLYSLLGEVHIKTVMLFQWAFKKNPESSVSTRIDIEATPEHMKLYQNLPREPCPDWKMNAIFPDSEVTPNTVREFWAHFRNTHPLVLEKHGVGPLPEYERRKDLYTTGKFEAWFEHFVKLDTEENQQRNLIASIFSDSGFAFHIVRLAGELKRTAAHSYPYELLTTGVPPGMKQYLTISDFRVLLPFILLEAMEAMETVAV